MMEGKLAELTKALQQAAKEGQESRVKGVGALSQELLNREMLDWNRFTNRRQVGSYTGLCPGEDSTGDSRMMLPIDKHGNPRVRALLVEVAWLLPKFQPDYKPLQRWKWLFDRDKPAAASLRKKAVVALARRLAIDLWRIKTGRAKAEDVGLKLAA
jgi:transposase